MYPALRILPLFEPFSVRIAKGAADTDWLMLEGGKISAVTFPQMHAPPLRSTLVFSR
jgi:hypothetical protein